MSTYAYPALGFDPAPGNPDVLDATARTCTTIGNDLASDATMLRRIGEHAVWEGEAAESFDERAATLSDDLDTAATAYGGVGQALTSYAHVLRAAQAQARAAEQDAALAKQRAGRLDVAVDELSGQIGRAADGTDTSSQEAERSRLRRRLADANAELQLAVDRARRAQQRARAAAEQAARTINALAQTRPYEQPGLLERATTWAAATTAEVTAMIDRWVDEHAELLRTISTVLKAVSAIATVLSFIPVLTPIMAPLAMATGVAALAVDGLLVASGNGDWKTLLVDTALTVIPGGRLAAHLTKAARAAFRAASRLRKAAKLAERSLSPLLKDAVGRHGGRLVGFEHRLKSHKSLRRKIRDEMNRATIPADEAAGRINDALRYTMEYPVGTLTRSTRASVGELAGEGLSEMKPIKNYWVQDNPYKGLNGQLKTADGQPVEVQFHTPESYAMKDATHGAYEVVRNESLALEARKAAHREMVRLSAQLEHPPGVEEIGELVVRGEPA